MHNLLTPAKIVRWRFFCLLITFSISAKAQTSTWDSTYRPDIYKSQVEQFRSFPRTNKDIVFLGNSIIHWANWNELLGMTIIKNRGIPGDLTFGVLDRLDDATRGFPAKIFVLIGINDISKNVPDSIILINYKKIIDRIKASSPSTKIYFFTLLPVNPEFKKLTTHYKNDHINAINKGLIRLAFAEKITVIDVYTPFLDGNGKVKANYTFDGVHPTIAGYREWVEILKKGNYLNR